VIDQDQARKFWTNWVRREIGGNGMIQEAAVSAALAGRDDEARKAVGRLRELNPGTGTSNFANMWPLRRPEDLAAFDNRLRLTGLPE